MTAVKKRKHEGLVLFFLIFCLLLGTVVWWLIRVPSDNPVSQMLAQRSARRYLQVHYAEQDVYLDSVEFSTRHCSYHALIRSHSSRDTEFLLILDGMGNVLHDTYERWVQSGCSTSHRLTQAYDGLIEEVILAPDFPWSVERGSGYLYFLWDEKEQGAFAFGMPVSELQLDAEYDILQLGREMGILKLKLSDSQVTAQRAAEMALDIRERFEKAQIPFRVLDLTLEDSRQKKDRAEDREIYAVLSYDDLYEEGLTARIENTHAVKKAYLQEREAGEE